MKKLPDELLLHVIHYLDHRDIISFLAISRRIRKVAQDNELWRNLCYERSYAERGHSRLVHLASAPDSIQNQAAAALSAHGEIADDNEGDQSEPQPSQVNARAAKLRAIANWDPAYPGESVNWYSEYISRYGPLSMSWTETAASDEGLQLEARGLGLYRGSARSMAVAPLDDGTLCLWDLSTERENARHRGSILARSKPGLLSKEDRVSHEISKANMTITGVVECVNVDSFREKAYIAVQSELFEVDLKTLEISSNERYPFSISALSTSDDAYPLTVGTNLSLHLYDHRQAHNHRSDASQTAQVDVVANFPMTPRQRTDFSRLLSGDEPEYASLFKPGPLSIHHLMPSNTTDSTAGEIYVAGRFPSVLVYDRRTFPRLRTNFHSGARLCSLTSLPYSFRCLESDLMRKQQLDTHAVETAKAEPGDRLIACGEYNGKGSLEIFGLSQDRPQSTPSQQAGVDQTSTFKNRVSASRSKLLSVTTHGTKILLADGDGNLRWFERNGADFIRAWNINSFSQTDRGVFSSSYGPTSGDVVRKLVPLNPDSGSMRIEDDEIIVWTGERIGLMSFHSKPRFGGNNGEEWDALSEKERLRHREQRIYSETMRRALVGQADEVRMMQGLGLAFDS